MSRNYSPSVGSMSPMKRCGAGAKIRPADRAQAAARPPAPERALAPRRDRRPDRRERMYLWRAVDHEGEVLDMLVQRRRNTQAALRLMRKLLKKQGFAPKLLVTDTLGSYGSAFRQLRLTCPHDRGLRSRDDDWRGSVRFARLYCCPAAFARAGVAVRAVVPFPVAAHQTGHADFRHPAF